MKSITVVKRSGRRESLALEKWQTQIAKVCAGIADVSQSMVEIKAQLHFYDGITTKEIDGITLRAIVDLIDVESNPDVGHTNYQYVAGKQRLSMLRKDVYGSYDPPHLYEIVKTNVATGLYTPELLEWYSEDDWNRMHDMIDHAKDESYSYAAVEQLIEKYLVKNRSTGQTYETPQVRYMVAAATVFHKEEPNTARMRYIKEYYTAASDGLFTLATPVLAGLGTPTKQFSSCVLIRSDDDLDSIFASGEMMAKYASKRAGIGLEIGRLRPLGSPIRGGEIMHTGMIPFLKKWFGDLRSCSQGGIRNASATVFYPIWHLQFDDLIVLKNNQGTEETRVTTHGLWCCAYLRSSGVVSRTKKTSHFLTPIKYLTFMKHFIKTPLALKNFISNMKKRPASVRKRWLRRKFSKVVFSRNEPILDVSI
jgi:ribonucleoside-diphosphate reductase alpha chain